MKYSAKFDPPPPMFGLSGHHWYICLFRKQSAVSPYLVWDSGAHGEHLEWCLINVKYTNEAKANDWDPWST